MKSLTRTTHKSYIFSLTSQEISDILSGLRSVSMRWPAGAAMRAGQLHDRLWRDVLNDADFYLSEAV